MDTLIILSILILILILYMIFASPSVLDSVIKDRYRKKGKIYHLFNPCNKCLVAPACNQHKICSKYQNWYLKEWLCKHIWETDRVLMLLPTSLMYSCKKCGKLK
jgi:hypothetical protein